MSDQKHGAAAFENARTMSILRSESNDYILAECWSILSERLAVLFPGFFSKLDDDLFKRSDRAENNALQNLYFETMRQMRMERGSIQEHYLERLKAKYDDFWNKYPRKVSIARQSARPEAEGDFSLLGNDTLEESLAISSMVEKGNGFFRRELYALNRRFSELHGADVAPDSNPLAPAAICSCFESTLGEKNQHLTIKLLTYKFFDREILSLFGPIYQEMNAYLASQGILPTITRASRQPPRSDAADPENDADSDIAQERGGVIDAQENLAYLEAFRSLQSLLMDWRKHLGMPSLGAYGGAMAFDNTDVLNALNLLQQPAAPRFEDDFERHGETLKQHLTHRLRTAESDARSLGRLEEDTIDMVQMIFDFMLDDKNMPDSVKGLLARLQIPVIKTAILDKTFFAKRNHPARTLLNSLAQAGVGLDVADSNNPIFKKIEYVVGRILQEFNQNLSLFENLQEEFSVFMEKESMRSKLAEGRARQATQSKEKMWLAKKAVASEISLRLQGKDTPATFQSFLYNDWKDVLILSYLRQDKAEGEWENALALLDRIIWSVTPPQDTIQRLEVIRAIPPLLKQIKEGLESISLDPHQVAALLKDLEKCHMTCLRQSRIKDSAVPAATPEKSPPARVAIRDPEIAEAIIELRENLPDISNVEIEEVIVGDIGGVFHARRDRSPSQETVKDDFMEQARSLNVGEWVEFFDEEKSWRAKLSWKSPVTSVYVFVNRRGAKTGEMRANELALRMRQGRARIVEEASTPLMDRALASLIESLKNPFWKTMQPPA
jgi:hypothetical protein